MIKLWFALHAFRFAKEKGLMNKRVLIAIAAVSLLVLALIVWAGIAVLGYLWRQAPAVIEGGRGLVTETVRRADEMLPGVKEKIEQAAPALSERAQQLWPGEAAPTQDVGGEDLPGVPRYAGRVRVAYALNEGKRSATYRGDADYAAVLAYYQRELAALGFAGTVLAATAREDIREYRKAKQKLRVEIRRHERPGKDAVEVVIAET